MGSEDEEEGNKCLNILYDMVTIIISIADISTDIIVLISFYIDGRTTFFVISLIILIISQLCYAVAFIWRYDIHHDDNIFVIVLIFCCILPIGWIVSFMFYFTDDKNSFCSKQFDKYSRQNWYNDSLKDDMLSKSQSKMTRWIIKKLSRHIGMV